MPDNWLVESKARLIEAGKIRPNSEWLEDNAQAELCWGTVHRLMGLKEPSWPAEDIHDEVLRLWSFYIAFPEVARMRAAQMMDTEKYLLSLLKLKRRPVDNMPQEQIDQDGELLVLQQDCLTLSKQYSQATLFRRVDLQRQKGMIYKHMSQALQEQEDGSLKAVERHNHWASSSAIRKSMMSKIAQ